MFGNSSSKRKNNNKNGGNKNNKYICTHTHTHEFLYIYICMCVCVCVCVFVYNQIEKWSLIFVWNYHTICYGGLLGMETLCVHFTASLWQWYSIWALIRTMSSKPQLDTETLEHLTGPLNFCTGSVLIGTIGQFGTWSRPVDLKWVDVNQDEPWLMAHCCHCASKSKHAAAWKKQKPIAWLGATVWSAKR